MTKAAASPVPASASPPIAGTAHAFRRGGHIAVGVLLATAFIAGGDSAATGSLAIAATQLFALGVLAWALPALAAAPLDPLRRHALLLAFALPALLAAQLLPVPTTWWQALPARVGIARDLALVGVAPAWQPWSLAPLAGERALWGLLPALAVFCGVLALPRARLRGLLLLFAWLAAASQVLGWLQVGAAQDSLVNPFPRWPLAFNGLFANPNHQGIAAALSVVAMVALASSGNPVDAGYWRSRRLPCGLALLALASLPMTGSRAALLLAIAGAVAALLLLRFETRGPRSGGRLRAGWAAVVLAMVAFAVAWVRFQAADVVRWSLVQTTAAMAWAYAPTGAGVGSFVPVFDQYAPQSLMQWEFFNHAHNEYVQWWFESGVAGMAVIACALWLLVRSRPRPRAKYQGEAVAAWVGCITLLLHSLVDYPLRTPALMAVAALLAGTMVAAARPNTAGAGR